MKIHVLLTPHCAPFDSGAAVMVDVLRASSTIITALAQGAKGIAPVATEEEARALAEQKGMLLGGERGGLKLRGFTFGNSPLEYIPEKVKGETIAFTTTNGTFALARAQRAELDPIMVSSFLNFQATLAQLKAMAPEKLTIFCAGRDGAFSLEDAAFAGLLAKNLGGELTDSAQGAVAIWEHFQGDPLALLKECGHGRYLLELGFSEDLSFCSRLDQFSLVPTLKNGLLSS